MGRKLKMNKHSQVSYNSEVISNCAYLNAVLYMCIWHFYSQRVGKHENGTVYQFLFFVAKI
jgi:hypothetical protein